MASTQEKDLALGRLCVAAAKSRLALVYAREVMSKMVTDYAGPYYGAQWLEEDRRTQPINLLSLYVQVMQRSLISKTPRVMLSTFNQQARPIVSAEQDWFNKNAESMRLAKTLKRIALNGLFSIGIGYTGILSAGGAALCGFRQKAGSPFLSSVDLDDFAFDIHCRDLAESGWMCHRVRIPREAAIAMYGSKARDLSASEDRIYNLEGDERISVLGRGTWSNTEEHEDYVDVWMFWLPRHRVIVHLADDYMGGPSVEAVASKKHNEWSARALKVQPWIGPPAGPYKILSFMDVPGNAMPKGPMQDYWDMHQAVNNISRKLIRQAQRQKQVLLVKGAASEDGSRVQKANDGEIIKNDDPSAMQQMDFGGPNQQNWVLMNDMIQRESWLMGNLDVQGGLSPQGKTATQEKILNQNSAGSAADLQETMVDFTADCYSDLLWFHHHHPQQEMPSTWSPKGLPNIALQRNVTPEMRLQVPWDQIDVRVDPYSFSHQTPQQRLQNLTQFVQQTLLPMLSLPQTQQQGINFNVQAFIEKIGQYLDDPDIDEITGVGEPVAEAGGGGGAQGMPAPQETRHIRESQSTGTQQGQQRNLQSALLGFDSGGAQKSPGMNGTAMGAT